MTAHPASLEVPPPPAVGWFRALSDSGHAVGDDAHRRRQKSVLTGASFLKAGMCPVWCGMLLSIGAPVAAAIPMIYATVTGLSIVGMAKNKDIASFRTRQAWFIFLAPMGVTIALGGLHVSSAVILWSFLAPVIALLFHGPRSAVRWLIGFVGLTIASLLIEVLELVPAAEISPLMLNVFAAMNVIVVTGIVFTAVWYHALLLEEERAAHAQLNDELAEKNAELLQAQSRLVQSEKMAGLGKLSAGMAHELNNPASAAQRGASHLQPAVEELRQVCFALGQASLGPGQMERLEELEARAQTRVRDPVALDPLDRMDREAEIHDWLCDHGYEVLESQAPALTDLGMETAEFEALDELYEGEVLALVLRRAVVWHTITSVLAEIGHGAGRIMAIVKALKSYSHLDRGEIQAIDLHEGLDDTLAMLGSVLKPGVTVRRDYDPELPLITANGGELNQVWTNLIDNAVAAMGGSGELTVRSRREGTEAVVRVIDTGAGIPAELRDRVFDPFVTSKAVGEGTGLGLNISHNIVVQKHHGSIAVESEPGRTCFEVRLPLDAPEREQGGSGGGIEGAAR